MKCRRCETLLPVSARVQLTCSGGGEGVRGRGEEAGEGRRGADRLAASGTGANSWLK